MQPLPEFPDVRFLGWVLFGTVVDVILIDGENYTLPQGLKVLHAHEHGIFDGELDAIHG